MLVDCGMAKSAHYKNLSKRITKLKKHFIPKTHPLGEYSDLKLDRISAFRVLSHAEIEFYLEERAKEIVKNAIAQHGLGNFNKVVLSLLAFMKNDDHNITKAVNSKQKDSIKNIDEIIKSSATDYYKILAGNNGIRKKDILSILLPLGISEDELDSAWLSTIDSYGASRGDVAHQSATHYRANYTIDPVDEVNTVETILDGIEELEKLFNNLL